MIHIEKYGAIDIGSNAIRLLISTVTLGDDRIPSFKKTSLVRVPIRLGADVFKEGKISEENTQRMLESMQAFKLLMGVHNIKAYRACATSAMREASNAQYVSKLIREQTGIQIHIIDGKEEASIIAATDLNTFIEDSKVYLYVDVGGGSTEFTIFANGEPTSSHSFKLGTVRTLNDNDGKQTWNEVKSWIKEQTAAYEEVFLIGSGGNINSIYKDANVKIGKPLTYWYLANYYKFLQEFSYEERVLRLGMNQDRADVILPALKIYLSAMKWAEADYVYVPKIGLSDGIIKTLYQEVKANELEVN